MTKCVCVGGVEEIGGDGEFLPTYLLTRQAQGDRKRGMGREWNAKSPDFLDEQIFTLMHIPCANFISGDSAINVHYKQLELSFWEAQ